ncbi:MAG: efflux RND transporter periplasmic adaptor subunit [Acidobacteria bacterium]|nr:efflux RND transporter periplasmic adaptor subunit [Acidobacteriota bacterium]
MPSNNRKGHKKLYFILGAVVVLAVMAGSTLLRSNHSIDPSKLAKVERSSIARSVVATGKVEPLAKVDVKSKATGIIKQLFVEYGDRVRPGQVLAELDKEELAARVREARANLQAAEANLEAAKAAYEKNKIEAEGPDVAYFERNFDRAQKMFSDGLIAQAALDEAEKNFFLARNHQLAAQTNVLVTKAEVERAGAQVAQARAALERAEEDLRNSTIVSPMDGLVLARPVEVGDAVSSILVLGSQATLVMTLGDVSEVYVKGKVDEADIGKVYIGQPARIVVESFKDKKFVGKVTKISPLGEEKDNVTTFEVRVTIENPTGELKANMTANAEIILEEKHDVLLIPETAVIYDRQRNTSVEVPDPKAEAGRRKLPVQTGISNGIKTEVVAGLNEGDSVILQ